MGGRPGGQGDLKTARGGSCGQKHARGDLTIRNIDGPLRMLETALTRVCNRSYYEYRFLYGLQCCPGTLEGSRLTILFLFVVLQGPPTEPRKRPPL